ncbi:MAG: FkbM family methyltransferase [Bacteroidota bacterium]
MSRTLSEHQLTITFKTEDVLGRHIYKEGICEPDNTACFLQNIPLKEHDVIIDVGANIGWFSLIFSRYGPANTKIFSFEPDPLNYRLLTKNVKQNNANQIICRTEALSNKEGKETLYLYPSKNRGRHSLLPINHGEQIEVPTTTLDIFLQSQKIDYSQVKFVKIDVEGYEYFVLQGSQQLLQYVPFVHTEYSPSYMEKGGVAFSDFLNALYQHKYTPKIIGNGGRLIDTSYESLLHPERGMDLLWIKG